MRLESALEDEDKILKVTGYDDIQFGVLLHFILSCFVTSSEF